MGFMQRDSKCKDRNPERPSSTNVVLACECRARGKDQTARGSLIRYKLSFARRRMKDTQTEVRFTGLWDEGLRVAKIAIEVSKTILMNWN
jgi:hypothetical protein